MLSAIDSPDVGLCNAMESRFKLLGPIERGHVWEPSNPPCSPVYAVERAWRIRQQVKEKLMRNFRQINRELCRGSYYDDEVCYVKSWVQGLG